MFINLVLLSLRDNRVSSLLLSESIIEVWDIKNVLRKLWLERYIQLFIDQFLEVNVCKPGVCLDILDTMAWTYSIAGLFFEQLLDKVFALFRHLYFVSLWIWKVYGLLLDKLVHLQVVIIASVKRRKSYYHFIGKDTQSPPINGERMTLFIKNFRSKIFWSTAEWESLGVIM